MKYPNPFGRRWWLPTIVVIAGVIFLAWLGVWQLNRLEERRAFNQYVAARWDQEPFDLTAGNLPGDINELEYRRVALGGDFDYANQIVLKNQNLGNMPGVNLVTPMVLEDGRAILVARGWVPFAESTAEFWPQFEEPTDATIVGMLQESQTMAGAKLPEGAQTEWFRIDIGAIQPQMPYELLPVFVTQLPEPGRAYTDLPHREVPFTIEEGNHFSYAIQWFMFAAILGIGYIQFMAYQERRMERLAGLEFDGLADPDDTIPPMPSTSENETRAIHAA